MTTDFGNIDKFQLHQAMKTKLLQLLSTAYENAMHVQNNFELAEDILKFRDHVNPVDNEDDSILPAGNIRHAVYLYKSAYNNKVACYKVAIRNMIVAWWEYIKKEKTTADEDKAIDSALRAFKKVVTKYESALVIGADNKGYALEIK